MSFLVIQQTRARASEKRKIETLVLFGVGAVHVLRLVHTWRLGEGLSLSWTGATGLIQAESGAQLQTATEELLVGEVPNLIALVLSCSGNTSSDGTEYRQGAVLYCG